MKSILIALLFLIPLASIAQSGAKNFIDQNYIEVNGKAKLFITPDQIYIRILLAELDNKNRIPIAELEEKMTKTLDRIGIDLSKDLFVKDISSRFKSGFLSKDAIVLSKEYQLLVRDGKTAYQVFLELENSGISNVSIEKLDHSKILDYRKEVKVNAIKAAKEKAELLAMAIDQNIGKALFIQEQPTRQVYYDNNANGIVSRGRLSSAGYAVDGSNLDFEKIELEYSMLCRFELK